MGVKSDLNNSKIIDSVLSKYIQNMEDEHFKHLSYVGEQFVNWSRDHTFSGRAKRGAYKNRTRNLLGSTGYIIALDGDIKISDISGTQKGKNAAHNLAGEVLRHNTKGLVLIGFAGMEYAAAVEAKGFDVITASSEEATKLLKELLSS